MRQPLASASTMPSSAPNTECRTMSLAPSSHLDGGAASMSHGASFARRARFPRVSNRTPPSGPRVSASVVCHSASPDSCESSDQTIRVSSHFHGISRVLGGILSRHPACQLGGTFGFNYCSRPGPGSLLTTFSESSVVLSEENMHAAGCDDACGGWELPYVTPAPP